MSERDNLLGSIAETIKTYRQGELPVPTPDHVDRWVRQFTEGNQLALLREFDHVIKSTFLDKKTITGFLDRLVNNEKLVGSKPAAYWAKANFLEIQKAGQSQKEMLSIFGQRLQQHFDLKLADCGVSGGDYIYLDDVLFTGARIATDLEAWIVEKAPKKATVQVIVMATHTGGHYYITSTRLKKVIATSGKEIEINFWRLLDVENQKNHRNDSDVLWPASFPKDAAVQAYIDAEKRFPHILRDPGGKLGDFSSEIGRQILEQEFLIAGVKIRELTQNPKGFIRPLGCSGFGVGFGSMIVTYRNCPNNCPLAMWWGDPEAVSGALHWYPLFLRKTYSSPENVFSVFDDD